MRSNVITHILVSTLADKGDTESVCYLDFQDKDGDGSMDRNEITELMEQKQLDSAPALVEQLFNCYDTDRSGTIDRVEFDAFTKAMMAEKTGLIDAYMAQESRWSSQLITPQPPSLAKKAMFCE